MCLSTLFWPIRRYYPAARADHGAGPDTPRVRQQIECRNASAVATSTVAVQQSRADLYSDAATGRQLLIGQVLRRRVGRRGSRGRRRRRAAAVGVFPVVIWPLLARRCTCGRQHSNTRRTTLGTLTGAGMMATTA